MDQHGPLFVIAGVLILAGIQMLAIGLLGELQVRHFHTSQSPAPYTVERIVRLRAPESRACCRKDRGKNQGSGIREQKTPSPAWAMPGRGLVPLSKLECGSPTSSCQVVSLLIP